MLTNSGAFPFSFGLVASTIYPIQGSRLSRWEGREQENQVEPLMAVLFRHVWRVPSSRWLHSDLPILQWSCYTGQHMNHWARSRLYFGVGALRRSSSLLCRQRSTASKISRMGCKTWKTRCSKISKMRQGKYYDIRCVTMIPGITWSYIIWDDWSMLSLRIIISSH